MGDSKQRLDKQLVVAFTPQELDALRARSEENGSSLGGLLREVGTEIANAAQEEGGGAEGQRHDEKFSFRLSEPELRLIVEAAAAAGLRPSTWLREAVLAKLGLSHLSPFVRATADGFRV